VLGPRSDRPITLEGTGVAIWDALETPRSPDELVALMAETFSTPPERIAADVGRLLDDLQSLGVVEALSP